MEKQSTGQVSSLKYCLNCGHEKHDGPLWRNETDYDGREYQIEVCCHYRGEEE